MISAMKRILPLLFLPALAQASVVANGGTETLLNGDTEVVHKFTSSGTFTLHVDSTVRILVVGGGGGGGGDCSAGGGGGGVIETNDVALAAGTYAVTVGAGGAFGASSPNHGESGGDSVVTCLAPNGAETELFRAYGGGGGACWNSRAGWNGGSGGGALYNNTPGKGVPGQGYDAVKDDGPGAGGGAGGSPVAANIGSGSTGQRQSSGGPGRTNDITGTLEVYGPGGGAGGYNVYGGFGGDTAPDADGWIWGCGRNHSSHGGDSGMTNNKQSPHGRDGYGGGGGGASNSNYQGGGGGSGVVIFRLSNELTSPDPTLAVDTPVPSWFSVSFPVSVGYAGAGYDTVSLSLQFSADAADFGADGSFAGTETLLDGSFFGSGTFAASDLKPAHAYYARLVARNGGGGATYSIVFAVTTLAQAEAQWLDASGRPVTDGLLMHRYNKTNANYESFDETTAGLVVMPGTVTAGISSANNASGLYNMVYVAADGTEWPFPSGISDGYLGYMWMEAGRQYNFFSCFYDNLRLKIGNDFTYDQPEYNSSHVVSFIPETTGWQRIQVWFGGSGRGSGCKGGWTYCFGWNADGATTVSGAPGTADWHMLDLASGAILKTSLQGREVSVAGYALDGGDLDFSVALSAGDFATVHAVWATAYPAAADDTNAWANASTIGPAGYEAQTLSATVPGSARYVRFYAVQEDGTVCWSPTAQIDLSAVSISGLGVAADGDTGTFSVRVGSVGTGTFSLALEIADNAAMTGARSIAIDASSPGDYAVTTNVAAGATSYYRFVATTTDGGHDETSVASFTTLAGTILPQNPDVSVNNRTITVSMPDLALGAGVQSWKILIGDSADETTWEERSVSVGLRLGGGYTATFAMPELPRTWRFRLVSENRAPGGTEWTSQTGVLSATTTDSVSYTWKASVAEGCWTNPTCWSYSSSDHLCTGFPSNGNCSVSFPANCTATIAVPAGTYPMNKYFANADGSHFTLVGEGRDVSVISGDGYLGTMRGETVEYHAMTYLERDFLDDGIGHYKDGRESTNAVLRLADGAFLRLSTDAATSVRGTNASLRVESGAKFDGDRSPLFLNGAGETLFVDDATLAFPSVRIDPYSSLGPQTARFAGKGAGMTVGSGLFADATDRAAVHDFTLLFEPASGGYTNGPVLFSSSTGSSSAPLGTMRNAGSTAKFRVVVDPIRMRTASAKTARGFAVAWKAGILEENVVLVPGAGYTLRYTYGWDDEANLPLDLDAPANESDLPTGVWFVAPSNNGTVFLLK